MKTDDLIRALAADAHRHSAEPGRMMGMVLPLAALLAGTIFLGALGPRPDIAAAFATVRFDFKLAVVAILAVSALALLLRIARPDADWRLAALLVLAPATLLAGVAAELMALPGADWAAAATGVNAFVCLTFIPLIGLGPLALFIGFLRKGAPVRPALAGAIAGVASGGLAALLYALHCTDDSPLFVAIWYTGGIVILAGLGALAGRLAVRW